MGYRSELMGRYHCTTRIHEVTGHSGNNPPLNEIQIEWHYEHEEALKEYARDEEEYELRRAAWKEQYKATAKKKTALPDRPADKPDKPKLRRLMVQRCHLRGASPDHERKPGGHSGNPGRIDRMVESVGPGRAGKVNGRSVCKRGTATRDTRLTVSAAVLFTLKRVVCPCWAVSNRDGFALIWWML